MPPVDAVTLSESALILGCSVSSVRRYVLAGRLASHGGRYEHRTLSRADVETLAAEVYPWLKHVHEPDTYWTVGQDAAVGRRAARHRRAVSG